MFDRKGGHFLFLSSQVRDKITTGGHGSGGKSASGGNAPGFYSSLIGQIQKPWTDTYIYENPSDTKSKILGRLAEIKLLKTYNETTGQIVKVPIKYGLKGGIWRSYEGMMIAQAWNFWKKSGAHFKIEESFAQELAENNIQFDANFHGEKQMRESFCLNSELVEYVIEKKGKVLIQ